LSRRIGKLQPVELEVAKTTVPGLSFNRRYHMKNGSVQFNPGKTNENIVRSAGPTDPELIFLAIKRKNEALAGLTSFALHADTVVGLTTAPTFPLPRPIPAAHSRTGVRVVVRQWAMRDINHVNVSDPRPQKGGEETERIGNALGNRVVSLFPSLKPVARPGLIVRSTTVTVPLQQYRPEQIAEARDNMKRIGGKELPFLRQVESYKIVDLQLRKTNALALPVQCFVSEATRRSWDCPVRYFPNWG